jgi:glycosyltransferase involved in cell wall biosynthesis
MKKPCKPSRSLAVKLILDARKIDDYGIGVYLTQLFSGLDRSNDFDCRFLCLKGTPPLDPPEEVPLTVTARNYDFREHLEIPWKVRGMSDYFYFSPHYVFPLFLKNRLVVTIHDVIHFKFPQYFRSPLKVRMGKFFITQVKKRASLIFTVSQTSKQDLVEMFSFRPEQIHAVPSGIADRFFTAPQNPSPFPFPYIITVSNLKPHKNILLLLEAFAAVAAHYPDIKLVLAGIPDGRSLERWLAEKRLQERVVIKGYVSAQELVALIDGAEFFVYPSLYEGFGFPPLEAMARGRAVISSTGGSLKEVLADSAVFFSPTSSEELAESITRFLDSAELRSSYAEKGAAHSQNFRWSHTLNQYIDILRQLD